MRLLLKYPTRSRPHLFRETVRVMSDLASGKHELAWLCSIDEDDKTMNTPEMHAEAKALGITLHVGTSPNKIHAINRDMDKAGEWDILINAADDMRPIAKGWDERVVGDMASLDSGVWYFDGNRRDLCTLSIFGKPVLYRMQGYIYHPEFISLYADNYYQFVMERWGRLKLVLADVFRHEWKKSNNDALMARNENRAIYLQDQSKFHALRKKFNETGEFL